MRDAVAWTGLGLVVAAGAVAALAAALAAAPAPPIAAVVRSAPARPVACSDVGSSIDLDERHAMALACGKFGGDFSVVSSAADGALRVVVVQRAGLAAAVVFRADVVEVVDALDSVPDAIHVREVLGHAIVETEAVVTTPTTRNTYRQYFGIEGGRLVWQLCLNVEGADATNAAARLSSHWIANVWIADEGTMYFVPNYTVRVTGAPMVSAYSFPFVEGRWTHPESEGHCIDPRYTLDHEARARPHQHSRSTSRS
jgi:hypothetical protein